MSLGAARNALELINLSAEVRVKVVEAVEAVEVVVGARLGASIEVRVEVRVETEQPSSIEVGHPSRLVVQAEQPSWIEVEFKVDVEVKQQSYVAEQWVP